MINKNAKWIWVNNNPQKNEYAYFEEKFNFSGKKAEFFIAAETDYILYVNGKQAAFSQFAGYPFEKYYDTIDITKFCIAGENTLSVTVRYEGLNSSTHIDDGAGVIYTLLLDGETALYSSEKTLGGYDNRYVRNCDRKITGQLGFASDMCCGEAVANTPCVEVEKTRNIKPRPVKKAELQPLASGVLCKDNIYDVGRETAGYLYIKLKSDGDSTVKVSYGQHLDDGCVREEIGGRKFYLYFNTKAGVHEFSQYFVKVSGRYLQVDAPKGTEVLEIGIIPVLYPQIEKPYKLPTELDNKIYEVCVRTLRLCMNLHYEDTPWREQALYVLDSRNQMLCGYYAFEETEFQRANIAFMAKGTRADGFMELTYPAVNTPAIPFFSVMYPVAVYEYIKHTGDKTILSETMPVMLKIMNNFKEKIDATGLIKSFPAPYWNFYEWTDGSADLIPSAKTIVPWEYYHLILNCAFIYSGEMFGELCKMADTKWDADFAAMRNAIDNTFLNKETGIYHLRTDDTSYESQLGNAFALLVGLGDERTVEAVKNDKSLIPTSLSMLTYLYDALLKADENNKEYIIEDIRKQYGYMLEKGATSFWETMLAGDDFDNAGSLCHGWSALPIYYYNKFSMVE